jgi:transmembrane sensor
MMHDEIADRAARFVMRRDEPGWSDADQAELDVWLAESYAHKAAYWRLAQSWVMAGRLAGLGPQRQGRQRHWIARIGPFAIAASVMLAALVTVGVGLQKAADTPVLATTYATPVGGHRAIGLPDGSRAELNTATRLRSALAKEGRQVWLDDGEAFFKVVHDPAHPFVVHAGRYRVTVLGTSFSVRRQGDEMTVSVLEGKVRVDRTDADASQALQQMPVLGAGQMAILRPSELLVTTGDAARVEQALAWRDGMLRFDGASLADVAADFNRYSDRKIVVDDPRAAKIRINGTFRAKNSAAFLRLLEEAYGLRVETDGNAIIISE